MLKKFFKAEFNRPNAFVKIATDECYVSKAWKCSKRFHGA